MKANLFFIIILSSYFSCTTKKKLLVPVVSKEKIEFAENEIPREIIDNIANKKVVILGETHYVQEHHNFISILIDSLSRKNKSLLFLQELPSAFNWMLEDYLNGEIPNLPSEIKYFDDYLFKNIDRINKRQEKNAKIFFAYMDVNHGKSFLISLSESEKIIGSQTEFDNLKSIPFDSDAYVAELDKINKSLRLNKEKFRLKWGAKWYNRYVKMIEGEVISANYRRTNDYGSREFFMFDLIKFYSKLYPNSTTIVNCGMYHAQKRTEMGRRQIRIGEMLTKEFTEQTYSIAFIGVKGDTKSGNWYNETTEYDLPHKNRKDDLISILHTQSDSLGVYLDLSNSIFSEKTLVSYHNGKAKKVHPANQFDAVILYPKTSILESMNSYEFHGY